MSKKTILYLGDTSSDLFSFLHQQGINVYHSEVKIPPTAVREINPDLIVSYGYRFLLGEEIFENYRAINLHISLLPWNRGSDPNFWSFRENTPKGVTIHEIDKGLDTGSIIFQKEVEFPPECKTLTTTYAFLKQEIENLFIENWSSLLTGDYVPTPQDLKSGSHHYSRDLLKFSDQMPKGWDTEIKEIKCLKEPI